MFIKVKKVDYDYFIPGKKGAARLADVVPLIKDPHNTVVVEDEDKNDCTMETLSQIIFDRYCPRNSPRFHDMKHHLEVILGEETMLDIIQLGGLEEYAIRLRKGLR